MAYKIIINKEHENDSEVREKFPEVFRKKFKEILKKVEFEKRYESIYNDFCIQSQFSQFVGKNVYDAGDQKSLEDKNCFVKNISYKDGKLIQVLVSKEDGINSRKITNDNIYFPAYQTYEDDPQDNKEFYEANYKIAGILHNLTGPAYVKKTRHGDRFESTETFYAFGHFFTFDGLHKKYSENFKTVNDLKEVEVFIKENHKHLNRLYTNLELIQNKNIDRFLLETCKTIIEKCASKYFIPVSVNYKERILELQICGYFAFVDYNTNNIEYACTNTNWTAKENSALEIFPREKSPAEKNIPKNFTGTIYSENCKVFVVNGKLHNENGPAVVWNDHFGDSYYLNGQYFSEDEFFYAKKKKGEIGIINKISQQAIWEVQKLEDAEYLKKLVDYQQYSKQDFHALQDYKNLINKAAKNGLFGWPIHYDPTPSDLEQKYGPPYQIEKASDHISQTSQKISNLDKNEKDLNMPLQQFTSGSFIPTPIFFSPTNGILENTISEVSSPMKEQTTPMKKTAKDHYKEAAKQAAYETAAEEIVSSIKAAGMLALQASHPNIDPKTLELLNNTYVDAFISLAIGEGMRHLPPHISENPHAIELGKRFTVQGMKQGVQPLLKIGKEMIAPMIEDVISRIPKEEALPPKRTRVAPKKKIEVHEDSEIEVEFKESESEKLSSRM